MASDQEKAASAQQPESSGSKMMFGDHQGIDAFSQATLREIMSISKVSNEIPCDETFALYSSFPAFKRIMDMEGKKCIELIGKMFKKYNIGAGLTNRDLEEKFDLVVDANDHLLEKINGDLDEAAGIKKKLDTVVQTVSASTDGAVSGRWNVSTNRTLARSASTVRLMTASNIERPQLTFRQKVNNSAAPFEPIITDKPHAIRPLAVLLEVDDEGRERFSHPYEFELERFQPAEWALEPATEPVQPPPADQTPVTMVASAAALQQLVKDLSLCREVAVDLEHHNYRSYLGLTCLMQISTRERDYIVDTLQLRGLLQPLNEVFANPNIVKVFHGADSDVEWLQRDCGLYLVNMFDTHQASKVLAFPRLSLAYLLQHFCNVAADKRLQLADWRIRPLPEDMIRYAQEDTHYLLYIYDRMRNLLLEKGNEQKNLLRSVYTNSTLVCLKMYRKPVLRPDSHMDMYRRSKKSFNNKQMSALAQLYRWRDALGRLEDESSQYVLPNHMLMQISELLPRELQGLLACCSPVPPLLRANLATAHKLVLAARGLSTVIEAKPDSTILVQAPTKSRTEYSSILHNPHDTSQMTEDERVNVPLLLTPAAADESMDTSTAEETPVVPAPTKQTPDLDVYPPEAVKPSAVGSSWISPYRRYLMMKDSVDDEKVVRRMAELTEMTPTRAPRPAGRRSPLPEPELVLPGLKAEDADKVAVEGEEEEEKEPPAPQKLRLSRKDVVREQKKAGTYRKAHKRKHGGDGAEGGPVPPPTIPLSESGPSAQRSRPAGQWSAEPETTMLPPDPFDYSSVDYRKFGRPDDSSDGSGRGGNKRGRGRGGRGRGRGGRDGRGGGGRGGGGRGGGGKDGSKDGSKGGRGKRGKNPWQQEGSRQQTFGGSGGRGRGRH